MHLYSRTTKCLLIILMLLSLCMGAYYGVRIAVAVDLVGTGVLKGEAIPATYEKTESFVKDLAYEVGEAIYQEYLATLHNPEFYEQYVAFKVYTPDYTQLQDMLSSPDAKTFQWVESDLLGEVRVHEYEDIISYGVKNNIETKYVVAVDMDDNAIASWNGFSTEYIAISRAFLIKAIEEYGVIRGDEIVYGTGQSVWRYNKSKDAFYRSESEEVKVPGMVYYLYDTLQNEKVNATVLLEKPFFSYDEIVTSVMEMRNQSQALLDRVKEQRAAYNNWSYRVNVSGTSAWGDRSYSYIRQQPVYWVYEVKTGTIVTSLPDHLSDMLLENLFHRKDVVTLDNGTLHDSLENYIKKNAVTISIGLGTNYIYEDKFSEKSKQYASSKLQLNGVEKELYGLIVFSVIFLICLIMLVLVVGYRDKTRTLTEMQMSFFVPTEGMVLLPALLAVILWMLSKTYVLPIDNADISVSIACYISMTVMVCGAIAFVLLELVSRARHKLFLKKSIIAKLIDTFICLPFRMIRSFCSGAVMEGVREMETGNLDYQIDTKKLWGQKKQLAESINNLQNGLKVAVEQSVRDERLKTELITNVSHDIKTPLTSIINYVDLLKKETMPNEQAEHYLEVLDQKSQRLKQLMEDLIEASKAASGNLQCNPERIDLAELLRQTFGEFEDKFSGRNLQLIENFHQESVMVMLDSRHTFRVFENLCQNAYKYAMPQSRIYVDLDVTEDAVTVCMKNVSEEPLNISPEELTERFVRGDQSRNTSGSGLGLSIAKNLVLLQKGEFDIILDGDLFKVNVTFPLSNEEEA